MSIATTSRVRDAMSRSVQTVHPDSTIGHVAEVMKRENVGCVAVIEQGTLVGIVTDRDIVVRGLVGGGHQLIAADTPVARIMTTHGLVTVRPDDSLEHAAHLMADRQVRRLPVTGETGVIGVISLGDVVQATGCTEAAQKAVLGVTRGA